MIRAPKAGVIKKVLFKEGSQANRHATLVEMEEEQEEVAQSWTESECFSDRLYM